MQSGFPMDFVIPAYLFLYLAVSYVVLMFTEYIFVPDAQAIRVQVLGLRAAVPHQHRAAAVDDGHLLQRRVLLLRHQGAGLQRSAARREVFTLCVPHFTREPLELRGSSLY